MLPLGTIAPPFSLRDVVSGQTYSLDSFTGKTALLVMFLCRHCPYVEHVEEELARIGRDYRNTGLGIIGISSNDPVQYPDDAPPRLKEMAERLCFTFPFCFDETQDVAKAYQAACTPDFYLFDGERRLVYRGQLDDSRPGNNKPVTGRSTAGRRPVLAAASSGNDGRNDTRADPLLPERARSECARSTGAVGPATGAIPLE
jgi:peroxiredoxin